MHNVTKNPKISFELIVNPNTTIIAPALDPPEFVPLQSYLSPNGVYLLEKVPAWAIVAVRPDHHRHLAPTHTLHGGHSSVQSLPWCSTHDESKLFLYSNNGTVYRNDVRISMIENTLENPANLSAVGWPPLSSSPALALLPAPKQGAISSNTRLNLALSEPSLTRA